MHTHDLTRWSHDHTFEQDRIRSGERRTLIVVVITAAMMVVEILAGAVYGSMALLADGLHMASHAIALGIALFAYVMVRRLARDRRFTFGAGKINSLGGFAGAVLLGGFALIMGAGSIERLIRPVEISFDQALVVAVVGLVVNAASAWLLAAAPHGGHHHGHDHHHHDHNLASAYYHVLADALTSLLAITALLAGKYAGAHWLDPVMGIVGAVLIARWSYGLVKASAKVLLDHAAEDDVTDPIVARIETGTLDRVADLHVWHIGPDIYAAAVTVVSDDPKPADHYRSLIRRQRNIVHVTVETHECGDHR